MITSDKLQGFDFKIKELPGNRGKYSFKAKIHDSIASPTTRKERRLLESISGSEPINFGNVALHSRLGQDSDVIATKNFKAVYSNGWLSGTFRLASGKKHLTTYQDRRFQKKHGFIDNDGVINDPQSTLGLADKSNPTASVWSALSWAKPTKVNFINNTNAFLQVTPVEQTEVPGDGSGFMKGVGATGAGVLGEWLSASVANIDSWTTEELVAGAGGGIIAFTAGAYVGYAVGEWVGDTLFPDSKNLYAKPISGQDFELKPGTSRAVKGSVSKFGFSNGYKDLNALVVLKDQITGNDGSPFDARAVLGTWAFDNPNIGSAKAYNAEPNLSKRLNSYMESGDVGASNTMTSSQIPTLNYTTTFLGNLTDSDDQQTYKSWDLAFSGTWL